MKPPAPILNNLVDTEIKKRISEILTILNKEFNLNIKMPPLYYDLRGTTAGMFKSKHMSIHLHPKLLMENYEDFIVNTIPHEICHLAVWHRYLLRVANGEHVPVPDGHGSQWKLMMRTLNLAPRVRHSYDVNKLIKPKKEYNYTCACPEGIIVGARVHQNIQSGNFYSCVKCGKLMNKENWKRVLKHNLFQF
jgi:SprT protein